MLIEINKKHIAFLIENDIPFRTVEGIEKEKKTTPDKWKAGLQNFVDYWNKVKVIGKRKGFKQTRVITDSLRDSWDKLYWKLYDSKATDPVAKAFKMVHYSVERYMLDIKTRDGDGITGYSGHRFALKSFISQKNGLIKFLDE